MLENSDIDSKIDELCQNFAELNHAHTLVLRAKEQIDLLAPIDKEGKAYEKLLADKEHQEAMRNGLSAYFARFKKELIDQKIVEVSRDITKAVSQKRKVDEDLALLEDEEISLRVELQRNGGDRVVQLKEEQQRAQKEQELHKSANDEYTSLAKALGYSVASNEHRFLKNAEDATRELSG